MASMRGLSSGRVQCELFGPNVLLGVWAESSVSHVAQMYYLGLGLIGATLWQMITLAALYNIYYLFSPPYFLIVSVIKNTIKLNSLTVLFK
jgi:hypothetical protein